jgi:hypothetical protein
MPRSARVESTCARCASEAESAGTATSIVGNPLTELTSDKLAELPAAQFESAATALREAANNRRESIRHLEQRHASLAAKQWKEYFGSVGYGCWLASVSIKKNRPSS